VQSLRQQARHAGNLNGNEREKVSTQGSTIVIEPANPDVVYVPAYDPGWSCAPIVAYPGWYPEPGIYWGGVGLSFGIGFGIGFFGDWGWGWATGDMTGTADERSSTITPSSSHSHEFGHEGFHHGDFGHGGAHGGGLHGLEFSRGSGFHGGSSFTRSGNALWGVQWLLITAAMCEGFSSRGRSSFGGASTEAVSLVAVADAIGSHHVPAVRVCREIKNGEESMLHVLRFCSTERKELVRFAVSVLFALLGLFVSATFAQEADSELLAPRDAIALY